MKSLFLILLSFFFVYTLNAQIKLHESPKSKKEYSLQFGSKSVFLLINADGSVRFSRISPTKVLIDYKDRIQVQNRELYLATNLDSNRKPYFAKSNTAGDKIIFEDNASYQGQLITKRFSEGQLYLVWSDNQLKWHKNYTDNNPIVLKPYQDFVKDQATTVEQRAAKERKRQAEIAQKKAQQEAVAAKKKAEEQKRRQRIEEENRRKVAAAEEQRRRAAAAAEAARKRSTNGKIIAKLVNFKEKCVDHYANLWSTTDENFGGMRKDFNSSCEAYFSGLKDGTYEVALYITFEVDGRYDASNCEGCGQKLVSRNVVTIVNGNKKTVQFSSK